VVYRRPIYINLLLHNGMAPIKSTRYTCLILMKLNFLHIFSKNTEESNFMKVRPVGAEFLHSEGRTDITKLIVAFHNFANAPKNNLITTVTSEFL
jgi:hypothetical protein